MLEDLYLLSCAQLDFKRLVTSAELVKHDSVVLTLVIIKIGLFNALEPFAELQPQHIKVLVKLDLRLALLLSLVSSLVSGVRRKDLMDLWGFIEILCLGARKVLIEIDQLAEFVQIYVISVSYANHQRILSRNEELLEIIRLYSVQLCLERKRWEEAILVHKGRVEKLCL